MYVSSTCSGTIDVTSHESYALIGMIFFGHGVLPEIVGNCLITIKANKLFLLDKKYKSVYLNLNFYG